ncbi:hypothetical protein FPV67DRAFT_1451084 [Lyophyllum atratum]|nr:hypothetical protein FPV67DRAFT_1451084 [Lyophyllum atratum]
MIDTRQAWKQPKEGNDEKRPRTAKRGTNVPHRKRCEHAAGVAVDDIKLSAFPSPVWFVDGRHEARTPETAHLRLEANDVELLMEHDFHGAGQANQGMNKGCANSAVQRNTPNRTNRFREGTIMIGKGHRDGGKIIVYQTASYPMFIHRSLPALVTPSPEKNIQEQLSAAHSFFSRRDGIPRVGTSSIATKALPTSSGVKRTIKCRCGERDAERDSREQAQKTFLHHSVITARGTIIGPDTDDNDGTRGVGREAPEKGRMGVREHRSQAWAGNQMTTNGNRREAAAGHVVDPRSARLSTFFASERDGKDYNGGLSTSTARKRVLIGINGTFQTKEDLDEPQQQSSQPF